MSDSGKNRSREHVARTLHGTAGAHWAASRLLEFVSSLWSGSDAAKGEGVGEDNRLDLVESRTASSLLYTMFKAFERRLSGQVSAADRGLLIGVSSLLRGLAELLGEAQTVAPVDGAGAMAGRPRNRQPALAVGGGYQANLTRAARDKATALMVAIPEEPTQLGSEELYQQLLLYAADLATLYQHQRRLHERIRDMEQMAKVTEKAAAAGLMSGGILHDVNHYLTVIASAAEMLPMELGDVPAPVREDLDAIAESAARAGALVHRFQYLSKPGAGQEIPFNLGDVVLNARSLLRRQLDKRGVKLVVELNENLPAVMGDPAAMEEVVINLLSNAIEILKSGGAIRVAVDAVAGAEGGRDVALLIQDNGPGVPPELQDRIFEPFVTGREGGTGLGLYLVRQIVERHGGTVRLFSSPGKGARFLIRLPAVGDSGSPGR